MHEFGHYIDGSILEAYISGNEDFIKCWEEEFENFKKNHTSQEQDMISYFSGSGKDAATGREETVAETHMLLNTFSKGSTAERAYYLQRYFPKTVALVADLLSKTLKQT